MIMSSCNFEKGSLPWHSDPSNMEKLLSFSLCPGGSIYWKNERVSCTFGIWTVCRLQFESGNNHSLTCLCVSLDEIRPNKNYLGHNYWLTDRFVHYHEGWKPWELNLKRKENTNKNHNRILTKCCRKIK